jgi:hypothetical protein
MNLVVLYNQYSGKKSKDAEVLQAFTEVLAHFVGMPDTRETTSQMQNEINAVVDQISSRDPFVRSIMEGIFYGITHE